MILNISLRISDDLERSRFLSLFEVMAPRLNDSWAITATEHADVVIVDSNQPGSRFFLNSCKRSVRALPILYAEENLFDSDWFLKKPVRTNTVIPLLNNAAQHLKNHNHSELKDSEETAHSLQIADKVDALGADNKLAALIALANETQDIKFFSNPRLPKLYFNPTLQTLYALKAFLDVSKPYERLRVLNNIDITQIYLVPVNTGSLESATAKDQLVQIPLDIALWASALHLSNGVLPKGISAKETVQLKTAPDFSRLPHQPHHLTLAAYQTAGPASLERTARKMNLSLDVVIDFFNACRSQELVSIGTREVIAQRHAETPAMTGGFLHKLFGTR